MDIKMNNTTMTMTMGADSGSLIMMLDSHFRFSATEAPKSEMTSSSSTLVMFELKG